MNSIALAFVHVLPWWSWLAVLACVLVIVFVPGALVAFRGLLALIPWRSPVTWLVIGAIAAVIGFRFWLDLHDQALRAEDAKEKAAAIDARDTYWTGREKAANDRYAHQLAAVQTYIDGEHAKGQAAAAALQAQADAERAARQRAEDALTKRRNENVTAEAARLCTLTRGVVLQFNAGAAEANGGDELAIAAAGAAGGIPVDAPAGVSLNTYAGAVDGTHAALRAANEQVRRLQRYLSTVIQPWVATAIEAVNRCTVKGPSP